MNKRTLVPFLLAALLLGVAGRMVPSADASGTDSRSWRQAPAPPTISISGTINWEAVPGTRVSWVRESERPRYDMFRYGSRYYIYNGGYWYRSGQPNRGFVAIDERDVPVEFAKVSSEQWRSYPPGWSNPKNPHYDHRHDNGHGRSHGGHDNGR